jgi:hypothetical protein
MAFANLINKLSIATASAALIALLNPAVAQSVVLVTNNVITPPPGKETPDVGICPPWCGNGVVLTLFTDSPPLTAINNTPFNVIGVIDIIPEDQDAIWGGAISNIFSSLVISPDGKKLVQSGGIIPPGGIVYPFRITNPPGSRIRFDAELIFDHVTVPETTPIWSLLAVGAVGLGAIFKGKGKVIS